jgi:hypothetical protein
MRIENRRMLGKLAVVALAMFGGGSFNVSELLLMLLKQLKLIPQSPGPASQQVFEGYAAKAWDALQAGQTEKAKMLMEDGLSQVQEQLREEDTVAPQGIVDQLKEWMKSPIFLIVLAVGGFLLFSQFGGCPKPAPAPQAEMQVQAVDVTE